MGNSYGDATVIYLPELVLIILNAWRNELQLKQPEIPENDPGSQPEADADCRNSKNEGDEDLGRKLGFVRIKSPRGGTGVLAPSGSILKASGGIGLEMIA